MVLIIAMVATIIPAYRATRLQPGTVLQSDVS